MARRKITDGETNKFVQEEDIEKWIEDGWVLGWYNQKELDEINREKQIARWEKVDKEEYKKKVSSKISKTLHQYHENLSIEEKEKKNIKRLKTRGNWSQEQREEYLEKMSKSAIRHRASAPKDYWEKSIAHAYSTRKKNHSFNTSKTEDEMYKKLCEEYGTDDIKRNYKEDRRYPFACDFYIISLDKFIELNACWTHGGRAFDSNDEECIEQLNKWRKKAEKSEFYKNAIYTWTDLDVRKQKIAKANGLNYEVVYP